MGTKLGAGGQCLRFLLIAWNILVVVIGLAALGVGIWQVVENNRDLLGEEYASGPILSIIAGLIAIGVAVLGILGAIGLWRPLLLIYAIIVTIFVILELVSGILGFVYRDQLEDEATDIALDAINDFNSSSRAREIVNDFQDTFECCGWNNFTDWVDTDFFQSNLMFPKSCNCDDDDDDDNDGSGSGDHDGDCFIINSRFLNQTIYKDGCRDGVVDFLRDYQLIVGAIGIVFAVIQIFVILIALALCVCVHRARGEYTTV